MLPIYVNLDIDECRGTELCKHNGDCINNNGSYTCDCTDGWQGQHCEDGKLLDKSKIMWSVCKWRLALVYPVNDIYLLLDVNECKVKDPCIHNGTCINNNGSYVCDCTSGWQGKHCEDGKYWL